MHQNETASACCVRPTGVHVPDLLQRCRLTAHDADHLARHLTGWDQVYDQITCGPFAGELDELRMPDVQIFRERMNQAVHQVCRVRPDAMWFGLTLEGDASRINGLRVESSSVMARPGNRQFELVTPANHDIYGIVVSRGLLEDGVRRNGCAAALEVLEGAEILCVQPAARAAMLRMLSTMLSEADISKDMDDFCVLQAQNRVVDSLLAMLGAAHVEACLFKSRQRRRRIVAKARAYLFAHRDRAVSIPELCDHTHVSRRTLQTCFDDVLGISPVVYLRRLRLNGIRRMLLEDVAETRGIGSVAADWGIDNFSQFSSDYKRLFGKSPSAYVKMARRTGMP